MNTTSLEMARAAKPRVQAMLRGVPQLAGVGITRVDDGYAIKVNFSGPCDAALPAEVDGVPIRTEVVGAIVKRTGE
jgi:hypothetical protein